MAAEGVDPRSIKVDWAKVRESQREKAIREVKASMLLSQIAEREAIVPTRDEVDREVERVARQQKEPVAAVHMRFEKDGTLGRIASHIQTEKTLEFSVRTGAQDGGRVVLSAYRAAQYSRSGERGSGQKAESR